MTEQVKKYVDEIFDYAKENNIDVGVAADKLRMNAEDKTAFADAEKYAREHYFDIVKERKEV